MSPCRYRFRRFACEQAARRSPSPLPNPSTHGQRSESPHPPPRPSSQSLEDLDPRSAPPMKCRRLQSPSYEPTDDQHLQITRSGSAPPWPTCTPGANIVAHSLRLTRQLTLGSPQSSVQNLAQSDRLVQLPLTSTKPSAYLCRLQRSSKCHNNHHNMERM